MTFTSLTNGRNDRSQTASPTWDQAREPIKTDMGDSTPLKVFSVSVRVVARASKSEVVGMRNGVLKVRIAAPPVDGAANTELVRLLAKHFGVPRPDVEIVAGETSKNKRVRISNITDSQFERAI